MITGPIAVVYKSHLDVAVNNGSGHISSLSMPRSLVATQAKTPAISVRRINHHTDRAVDYR